MLNIKKSNVSVFLTLGNEVTQYLVTNDQKPSALSRQSSRNVWWKSHPPQNLVAGNHHTNAWKFPAGLGL